MEKEENDNWFSFYYLIFISVLFFFILFLNNYAFYPQSTNQITIKLIN